MKFVPCLPVVYEMACGLKWQNSAVILCKLCLITHSQYAQEDEI